MGSLVHILSGARASTIPSSDVDAVLVNLPEFLRESGAAKPMTALHSKLESSLKILDSGGKQIFDVMAGRKKNMTKFVSDPTLPIHCGDTLNIHPVHLGRALSLAEFDVVQALDYPLPATNDPEEIEKAFKDTIDLNIRWALESIEMRDKHSPSTEIFLPFHGNTKAQLDYFLNGLGRAQYDGLSLPARHGKVEEILNLLMAFHERGIKKVHTLGSCKLSLLGVLAYLARNNYFEFVSFDASTWRIFADTGCLMSPFDLRGIRVNPRLKGLGKHLECHVKNFQKNAHTFLREANFRAVQITARQFFEHAESPESLRDFLLEKTDRIDIVTQVHGHISNIENNTYVLK